MNSMGFISVFNPKIIFQSWVDSLKIFLPANLIRFLKETLNRLIEGAKVFFSGFFWIGIIFLGIGAFLSYMELDLLFLTLSLGDKLSVQELMGYLFMIILIIKRLSFFIWFYVMQVGWIASIRSSAKIKNFAYVKSYFWPVTTMIFMFIVVRFNAYMFGEIQSNILLDFITGFLVLIEWIALFFFVESDRSIIELFQSFKRMFLVFIFNFPGLLIFLLMPVLVNQLSETVWSQLHWVILFIVQTVGFMIFMCALYTYFMQRVNANKKLYS